MTNEEMTNFNVDALKEAIEGVRWGEMEKIKPSGTTAFKLDFAGYQFTIIKNDLMQDGYALVSQDIYEKMHKYFSNLPENKKQNG